MTLLVAITGGSGSGKSTLALGLRDALPKGAAVIVSEDWYYRDCSSFPDFDPETFDFDHIRVRDHARLLDDLQALKGGQPVAAPAYDFVSHSRQREGGTVVRAAAVVIVEGSHLLSAPNVAAAFDLKVYVDTPSDVRFIRRLLRDQAERGRSAESVIAQYLATVRPAHAAFTAPAKARADIVISDTGTAVGAPSPQAVADLIQPVLDHPKMRTAARAPVQDAPQ